MKTEVYAEMTRKDGADTKPLNSQIFKDWSYRLVTTGSTDVNRQGRCSRCPSPGPMGEIQKGSFSNLTKGE